MQLALVAPEEAVIDMRVPVAQRDEIAVTREVALQRRLVLADTMGVARHAGLEFRRAHFGRQKLRRARGEREAVVEFRLQPDFVVADRIGRGGLGVEGKQRADVAREGTCLVRGATAGRAR